MDDRESKELLEKKLEEDRTDPDDLSALSSRLEHLPLALVQAATFMKEKSVSVRNFLELLDKSDQDLVDLLSEDFETVRTDAKAPRAVAETWILSFEQIQEQNAFSSELISLMSFFDRQAIPSEFLAYYCEQPGQKERGEMQLQKALGVLKAFSFVTVGKDQSLDVHRLVQVVSRKWLAREERVKRFAGQALLAVSHAYPFGNYKNWVTCRKCLPHVYAVLKFEGTGLRDEKIGKAALLDCTGAYLHYQGQWKEAERLQLEAVELRREVGRN